MWFYEKCLRKLFPIATVVIYFKKSLHLLYIYIYISDKTNIDIAWVEDMMK